jgi:hypothetical protein
MRRLLLIAPVLLLALGCGDDGGGGDALGDDPTREECVDALVAVLHSLQVPDGVDPSDGLDADEKVRADAAIEEAFARQGIDPDIEDHPCDAATSDMTAAEYEEATEGVDPEVIALIGAQAQSQFSSVGEAIN